jgi:fatty acid amide hydrolase 2
VYPLNGLANNFALDSANIQVPVRHQVLQGLVEGWSTQRPRFWGVPCSVKECISLKGMPNTSGLFSRKDCTASEDAPVVRSMRTNGLIPLVNTNVSELCMWYESSNRVYGQTNNGYHTDR